MYKLNEKNGSVDCVMRAGKDFVKTTMTVETVKEIIKNGEVERSDRFEGYGIVVDDLYFIDGYVAEDKTNKMKK